MALVKCPGCDKDVSINASACPNCGEPIKETTITQNNTKKVHKTKVFDVISSYKMTLPVETEKEIAKQTAGLNVVSVSVAPIQRRAGGFCWSNTVTVVHEVEEPIENIQVSNTTSGGCYIATSVYGSYDCPNVWVLRRYRDSVLTKTWLGKKFITTYYAISPVLVKYFGKNKYFYRFWKTTLDKLIQRLQNEGFDSTPYNDRNVNSCD